MSAEERLSAVENAITRTVELQGHMVDIRTTLNEAMAKNREEVSEYRRGF